MISWSKQKWGDDLIVPGERIGGFLLGKQPDDFLPQTSSGSLADWSGRCNVGVEVSETEGLLDATTANPVYHTEEGFKVDSPFSAVIAAWGEPTERHPLEGGQFFDFRAVYEERGIDFAVKDDTILYIGVFRPAMRSDG